MPRSIKMLAFTLNETDFNRLIDIVNTHQGCLKDVEKTCLKEASISEAQEAFRMRFYAEIIGEKLQEQARMQRNDATKKG